MNRPSRRYYFSLAERLGMSVPELLRTHSSSDLAEWMAYDMTQNEEWVKNYRMKQMTPEQTTAELMRLFKPRKQDGNN